MRHAQNATTFSPIALDSLNSPTGWTIRRQLWYLESCRSLRDFSLGNFPITLLVHRPTYLNLLKLALANWNALRCYTE